MIYEAGEYQTEELDVDCKEQSSLIPYVPVALFLCCCAANMLHNLYITLCMCTPVQMCIVLLCVCLNMHCLN